MLYLVKLDNDSILYIKARNPFECVHYLAMTKIKNDKIMTYAALGIEELFFAHRNEDDFILQQLLEDFIDCYNDRADILSGIQMITEVPNLPIYSNGVLGKIEVIDIDEVTMIRKWGDKL